MLEFCQLEKTGLCWTRFVLRFEIIPQSVHHSPSPLVLNLKKCRLINHNPDLSNSSVTFFVVSNTPIPHRPGTERHVRSVPLLRRETNRWCKPRRARLLRMKPSWLCPIKAGCETLLRFSGIVPCYAHLAASGKSTPGAHWLAWRLTSVLTLVHWKDWWAAIDLLQWMLFLMNKEDYIISNNKTRLYQLSPLVVVLVSLTKLQQDKYLARGSAGYNIYNMDLGK